MKIGYLMKYSRDEVKWAAKVGFKCLAISFAEDLLKVTDSTAKNIRKDFQENNLKISALGTGMLNHLSPDEKEKKLNNQRFIRAMNLCPILGTNTISTNVFGNPDISIEENIPEYQQVFGEYADKAKRLGIKIAIENCPHVHTYPIKIGNIALSPYAWNLMFKAIPSKTVGLEFDPSHLVWLGIDYLKAAKKFGNRIYHVHAKDTEIIQDALDEKGIYGDSWWRYRIPGWGVVDWQKFFATLLDTDYQGDIDIEHEDPVFEGPRFKEGLILGLRHLSQFITQN